MRRRSITRHTIEDHRGVTIYLRGDGIFETKESEAGVLEAKTLPEIRALIDKTGQVKREKQPGLILTYRGYYSEDEPNKIERVTVTSVLRERDHRGIVVWINNGGSRSKENARVVYKDTPVNMQILKDYVSGQKNINRLKKEADELLKKAVSFEGDVKNEPE